MTRTAPVAGWLMPTYAPAPVTFVRGEGSRLWDDRGRSYLDLLSGIAVTSLGHCHPAVAEAIAVQARTLGHVSNLFRTTTGPEVAGTLDRLIGGDEGQAGGQVFFANSGAEANECAIKLARKWAGHGSAGIVTAYGSFHGRTMGALAATGQPSKQEAFQPLPEGFRHVAWDDVDALEAALDPSVGAVLLEPMLGEAGVVPAAPDYLTRVRRLCDERGLLLMVDEIQTGLGRTGRWWGFQHEPVRPDVVTVAKSLGNGMPIGACWARAEVAAAFRPGDHGSTFGGQPLAAAAARATLAVMEEEDVPARAERAGARLAAGLAELPGVAAVRGRGLLLGVVLGARGAPLPSGPGPGVAPGATPPSAPSPGPTSRGATSPSAPSPAATSPPPPSPAAAAAALALERGLVVNAVARDVMRLAPSLLISDAEVDEALDLLGGVLADIEPPAGHPPAAGPPARQALAGRAPA